MAIDEAGGVAFFAQGNELFRVQIIGGREGALQLDHMPPWRNDDPFPGFRLADDLQLQPGERLGTISISVGEVQRTRDPVVELLRGLKDKSIAFNKAQKIRREIVLDADALSEEMTSYRRQCTEEALAFNEGVPIGNAPGQVDRYSTYVIIYLDPPDPHLVAGGYSVASYFDRPVAEEQDELVKVSIVPRKHAYMAHVEEDLPGFDAVFGLDPEETKYHGHGVLDAVIEPLLGYDRNETLFGEPDSE